MPTGASGASSRGEGGFGTVFGTATLPTGTPEASRRGEGGFRTVFGTATMPTGTSEPSQRGEEPPDQRQTGLCSMQRPVILSPGLPPDLPDGFIRRAYRPSDRPALPTALPEALAGRVTWVILTGWFYTPDLPAGFVPAARPASLTSSPTGSLTSQPNRPAHPTSPTDPPSTPAKVAPPPLTGRLRSAGRRLRGWR